MNEKDKVLFRVDKMLINEGGGAISAVVLGGFNDPNAVDSEALEHGVSKGKLGSVTGIILINEHHAANQTAVHLGMDLKNKGYRQVGAIQNPLGDGRDGYMFRGNKEEILAVLTRLQGSRSSNWLEDVSKLKEIDINRGGAEGRRLG